MATAETGLAAYADPGVARQSTGKPDEIERTPVRFGEGVPEKCRATATRRHPTLLIDPTGPRDGAGFENAGRSGRSSQPPRMGKLA